MSPSLSKMPKKENTSKVFKQYLQLRFLQKEGTLYRQEAATDQK